jgi:hypothetical protein
MIPGGDKWGSGEFSDPELSPGFAHRVLRIAAIERRRRVRGHFVATVGLCAIVSFVGTLLVRELVTRKETVTGGLSAATTAGNSGNVKGAQTIQVKTGIRIGTVDEAAQRGALDYLFPDARWSDDLAFPYANHTKPNANATDSAAFSPIIRRRCPQCPANRTRHKQQIAETDSADSPSPPQRHLSSPLPLAPADASRQSEVP